MFPGRVLVAGGWKPGFSTDYDAVLLASRFQADTLVNLSNVARIYSADPKTDPNARPLDRLRWAELAAMVGTTWVPGKNVPFDPVATAEAARIGLRVVVAAGETSRTLKRILAGAGLRGHGRRARLGRQACRTPALGRRTVAEVPDRAGLALRKGLAPAEIRQPVGSGLRLLDEALLDAQLLQPA